MAKFIFDTNALIYVIASKHYQKLNSDCHIMDLTFYEYGNAVMNILANRKRGNGVSKEQTMLLVQTFQEAANLMPIIRLESGMMHPILEIAEKEKLTFYDASYLYCSHHYKYTLVTGDRKLLDAAEDAGIDAMETTKWAV